MLLPGQQWKKTSLLIKELKKTYEKHLEKCWYFHIYFQSASGYIFRNVEQKQSHSIVN